MLLIEELLEQAEAIDLETVEGPQDEVKDDQTVIGVFDDRLKRLFALRQRLDEDLKTEARRFQDELDAIDSISQKKVAHRHFRSILKRQEKKVNLVSQLMWAECYHAYNDQIPVEAQGIGVAQGFQFYWQAEPESCSCELCSEFKSFSSLGEALAAALGGRG